ncbi:MAG TPA: PEP/pyruvate-binding domain-containing protein [Gemmatimonadales bacterium]|nr:PEP/pyruvate-binding domain-containing protein [Gemmatimonadales bacterium]
MGTSAAVRFPDVVWLEQLRRDDAPVVGGKAANLGELAANGLRVPPGFVITAPAYRRFLAACGAERELALLASATVSESEEVGGLIAGRLQAAAFSGDLEAAIAAAWTELARRCGGDLVVAVRSSATAEDLETASFAGQHGTYYYVSRSALPAMIRSCWASLWSREAISYRATHGVEHASVLMAVIVQQMIPAEISGVAFTMNPVTGATDEIVVESSWGMGAGIVDGRVTPDRYVVERAGFQLKQRRVAEKRFRVSTTLRRDAVNRVVQVPLSQQRAETLGDEQVVRIARLAARAERHFGAPQDVEWALSGGELYVLQSRPVTATGNRPYCRNEAGGKYVLFKPLFENFTEPLTPLTANLFMQGAIAASFRLIGGRVYQDLARARHVVPLRLTDAQLAQLLYLSGAGLPDRLRLSLARLPGSLLFIAALTLLFANLFARTAHLPADFMDVFRRRAEAVDGDDRLGVVESWRSLLLGGSWLQMVTAPVGHHVMAVNSSSMRYMAWMAVLKLALQRWAPDLPADALGVLTAGGEGVLSVEAGRGVRDLADSARKLPAVRAVLVEGVPEEALERLQALPSAAPFLSQLEGFLAKYGHRALREFELRSPRWEEEPSQVLAMVRNYLLVESAPAGHERKLADRRAEVVREINERLERRPLERLLGLRRRLVGRLAERVRYYARMRENSRFYWVMGAHVTRRKILRLESRLIASGKLRVRDDIFFLEWPEIEQLERGELGWLDVQQRIAERRREFVRLSKLSPPRTIGIESGEPVPATAIGEGGVVLNGQTASPGRCEGVARVILDPAHNAQLLPGEVLVAPYTDPAWTPLFLTAGAAVVEVGSFLSHAGTVAREYGLPCVVDVANCCSLIRSGDRLEVDGDTGVVRVLR